MSAKLNAAAAVVGLGAMLGAGGTQALTIVPVFGSSITRASNTAQIEATIRSAAAFYSVFANPATVSIVFETGPTALGASGSSLYFDSYSDYTNVLKTDSAAHGANTVLKTAVANLAAGNKPLVESDTAAGLAADRYVVASSALFRADTGESAAQLPGAYGSNGVYGAGSYDGVIELSNIVSSATGDARVAYGATVKSDQYGATAVIQHEIDEVLGGGGTGSTLGDQTSTIQAGGLKGVLGALDLYRYGAPAAPSFKIGQTAYFSLDGGKTNIHGFNPNPAVGDAADWAKSTSAGCASSAAQYVQDYFGCPGRAQFGLTTSSVEIVQLEALGYDLGSSSSGGAAAGVGASFQGGDNVAVPEPGAWSMLLVGGAFTGGVIRRRRALA